MTDAPIAVDESLQEIKQTPTITQNQVQPNTKYAYTCINIETLRYTDLHPRVSLKN